MKEFLYIFRGGDAARTDQTPEEMQAHMQKWSAWMSQMTERGKLVRGEPLLKEGKVLSGSSKVLTDGPFVEGKEVVGGYLLVKENDLNSATEMAKD
ncbi:MAG: YciI family protein [Bacteroidetes bacterium]|nr:YciI family protein [Bacteroidota bacterium]MDA1121178.1 YciI family protein [Bacteroidota bacterium]